MSTPNYQVMPPLTAIEEAELRASIEMHGVQVPVLVDENGAVIDGHHRRKLAAELCIRCPTEVREGLSDEQKRTLARTLNIARRHLTREQRRELIAAQLRETPKQSDRLIAALLGVSDKTVGTVRDELIDGAEFPHHETIIGKDGVEQPREKKPKTEKPRKAASPPASAANEVILTKTPKSKPGAPLKPNESQRAMVAVDLHDLSERDELAPFRGVLPDSLLAFAADGMKEDFDAECIGWTLIALQWMNSKSLGDPDFAARLISECDKHGMNDLRAFLWGALYSILRLMDHLPPAEKKRRHYKGSEDVVDVSTVEGCR